MKKKQKKKRELPQRGPAKPTKDDIIFARKWVQSWKKIEKKIDRVVAAAKEVSDCELSPKHGMSPEHGMLFLTIVEKLAYHMRAEPDAGKYVLQKICDELESLESKRPVRKSDLYYDVIRAFTACAIREKRPPTHSELCSEVKEIRGITTSDEKLERNVRFVADSTGFGTWMTKWEGS